MNNNDNKTPNRKPINFSSIVITIIILFLLVGLGVFLFNSLSKNSIQFNNKHELIEAIDDGVIDHLELKKIANNADLYEVVAYLREGSYGADQTYKGPKYTIVLRYPAVDEIANIPGVDMYIKPMSSFSFLSLVLNLLPIVLIIGMGFLIFKNMKNMGGGGIGNFSQSRAKLVKDKHVTFADVAGAKEEKEELAEIVDFLKKPKKYIDIGARIPKGVLLSGRPGTGKTLLARAVAGESNVPFFTISGSDFVELYVGIGASRVRDLFKTAKENSPCIIFIDEIDAVGRQRGAGLGGGHDEREQTLNQLLVEMDGFTTNEGIIMIAATNRADVLDPALLRPGRFDRQITIDLPDLRARAEILAVHARNKSIAPEINFTEFAARIPGFSGADIENILNEGALLAARDNRTTISLSDLDEAMDRVSMGPAKKSRTYSPTEKRIVAYHEAGHAVIGIRVEDANIVQKVTIIPRGDAGGYNLMVPKEERFLQTKKSLLATITGYLGGRVAEEIEFDSITTGAFSDFQTATSIARAMVTSYGMSDLGPIQYEQGGRGSVFLGRDYLNEKNFSDKVAHEIDSEVRKIINECYARATKVITENKLLLDNIAKYLMAVETLSNLDIVEITETGALKRFDEAKEESKKQEPKVPNVTIIDDSETR